MSNNTLKIISLNVRGLNLAKKRQILMHWFKNNRGDILFMQETFCKTDFSELNNNKWESHHSFTNSAHSRGVLISINKRIPFTINNIHKKNDGRAVLINAKIKGVDTTLCSVYAPSEPPERKKFFKTFKYWLARNTDHPNHIILGGDFNCVLNKEDR